MRGTSATVRRFVVSALLFLAGVCAAIGVIDAPAGAEDGSAPVTVATTPEGEPICVTCHDDVSRNVVETWRSQNHGRNGVSCAECHNSHEQDFTPHPLSAVCFGCHDVAAIHPDFTPETEAARCMECHTANVHWRADSSSWFYGGLPREDLGGSAEETAGVSASAGRATGLVVVAVALLLGLAAGFVADRFVRGL